MADEPRLSPEEISRRIVLGMGLVYDLFNELLSFLRMIRETLENSELEVSSLMGKGYRLPLAHRKSRTAADNYLAVDLGLVLQLGVADTDDEDDSDDDDGVDDAELEKRGVQITPESQFLAFRVLLYDRKNPSPEEFKPTVVAAFIRDISKTSSSKSVPSDPTTHFTLPRNQFLRLIKQLDTGTQSGQIVTSHITKGQARATVVELKTRWLAAFQEEEDVRSFLDEVTQMTKV